jgi:hypothetical protein
MVSEVQSMMSMIRRTSPFGEMPSLRQAMDRLFETAAQGGTETAR